MKRARLVSGGLCVLLLSAFLALPSAAARADEGESDTWMAVYIGGAKAGWMHARTAKADEGGKPVWVTTTAESFSLARLGTPMTIAQNETVVEDAAGQVLRFTSDMEQGPTSMKTEGTVADGKIHLVKNGVPSDLTYPAGALGPAAVDRKTKAVGIKSGVVVEALTFSTDAPGTGVTVTSTVGATEKKDVLGRVLFLYRVDLKNSLIQIPMTSWVDEHGRNFVTSMTIPGLGEMNMFETEEAVAKADVQPAELFLQNEIEPDRAIANPRGLKKAVYRISKKAGTLDKIYEGEGQTVVAKDGKLEVAVESWVPPADFKAATRPFAPAGMESCLAANAYIETGDELVKKFAAEAVGDEKDAVKCARLIEGYVRRKITKKDFNVGFATAAETAKSCEGDCTEHGVLCAALARAVGLPARVVMGVVYVGPEDLGKNGKPHGIFGFHMWTEVLVAERRWLPIDAAIGVHDATHIAFAKNDLASASPEMDMMLPLLNVLGSIQIEVLEPK